MAVRLPLLALLLVAALAVPAGANASIVPGMTIDGPSADVQSAWDIDLARDGSGALVYLKKVGGVDHVFVSRYVAGVWQAPERVDTGQTEASLRPSVAVSDGGRIVVVWAKDLIARDALESAIKPTGSDPFTQKEIAGDPAHHYVDVDMGPTGVAYAVFTSFASVGQYDVRASRLDGVTWTAVGEAYPGAGGILDFDPAKDAGDPDFQHEPHVAVDASGNATAVWAEEGTNVGDRDVYLRRLLGTNRGPTAHKAPIDSLEGAARGGQANHPDIDTDDAGNPWAVFREPFKYGSPPLERQRALGRQLVGETLGPLQVLDGQGGSPTEGNEFPRVDITGSGQGLAAFGRQLTFETWGSALNGGTWMPGFRVDTGTNTAPPFSIAALGENGNGMFAWRHDPGGGNPKSILARRYDSGALAPNELLLSNAAFGDPEQVQLESAADANGNVAVVFTQGPAATRRVVVAVVDGPPPLTPPVDPVPNVTGVAVVPTTFTEGTKLPALLAVTGTRINFALSENSRTRLSFELAKPGRLVGGKCRKQTRSNRKRKKCTRYSKIKKTINVNGKQGPNRVRFQGRITKKSKLKPGRYRLTVVATDPAGQVSTPKRAKFRMKARKRKR